MDGNENGMGWALDEESGIGVEFVLNGNLIVGI